MEVSLDWGCICVYRSEKNFEHWKRWELPGFGICHWDLPDTMPNYESAIASWSSTDYCSLTSWTSMATIRAWSLLHNDNFRRLYDVRRWTVLLSQDKIISYLKLTTFGDSDYCFTTVNSNYWLDYYCWITIAYAREPSININVLASGSYPSCFRSVFARAVQSAST